MVKTISELESRLTGGLENPVGAAVYRQRWLEDYMLHHGLDMDGLVGMCDGNSAWVLQNMEFEPTSVPLYTRDETYGKAS